MIPWAGTGSVSGFRQDGVRNGGAPDGKVCADPGRFAVPDAAAQLLNFQPVIVRRCHGLLFAYAVPVQARALKNANVKTAGVFQ